MRQYGGMENKPPCPIHGGGCHILWQKWKSKEEKRMLKKKARQEHKRVIKKELQDD